MGDISWYAAGCGARAIRRSTMPLVKDLMAARRAVREVKGDPQAIEMARRLVDQAKVALGERGDPWRNDGAPDYNRHMAKNTPYADWFASL